MALVEKSLTEIITFLRASGNATIVSNDGTVASYPANTPRMTTDGMLIEDASTNLLSNTDTLATQTVPVVADQPYTLTFYGTGTLTLSSPRGVWAYVEGSGANARTRVTLIPRTNTLTLTVGGSVTKAQLEPGLDATSYIPSVNGPTTRAKDLTSFDMVHGGGAFTLFLDFDLSEHPGVQPCTFFEAGSAAAPGATQQTIKYNPATGSVRLVSKASNGLLRCEFDLGPVTKGVNRIAVAFDTYGVMGCSTGGRFMQVMALSGRKLPKIDIANLMSDLSNSLIPPGSTIARFAVVVNRALPAGQLEAFCRGFPVIPHVPLPIINEGTDLNGVGTWVAKTPTLICEGIRSNPVGVFVEGTGNLFGKKPLGQGAGKRGHTTTSAALLGKKPTLAGQGRQNKLVTGSGPDLLGKKPILAGEGTRILFTSTKTGTGDLVAQKPTLLSEGVQSSPSGWVVEGETESILITSAPTVTDTTVSGGNEELIIEG